MPPFYFALKMLALESLIEKLFVNVVDGILQTVEHGLPTFADKARDPNRVERMSRPKICRRQIQALKE